MHAVAKSLDRMLVTYVDLNKLGNSKRQGVAWLRFARHHEKSVARQ
jgi:hypothetical protein